MYEFTPELLPVKRTVKNHKILRPATVMLLVVFSCFQFYEAEQ